MPVHPRPQPPQQSARASAATRVDDAETAAMLAQHLRHEGRDRPVVVVTVPAGLGAPYVDVAQVLAAVEGLAEVYVVTTGAASLALSAALPPGTQVYGGASRVYPVDREWQVNPRRSPLRFAFGSRDRDAATEAVVSDALTMAHAAGLTRSPAAEASLRGASGVVLGVVGGRALAQVDGGTVMPAVIWPELVVEGVRAERLFEKGMAVRGIYDPDRNLLDVASMRVPAAEALAGYAAGESVLARVAHVERSLCVVELLPDVQVELGTDATGGQGTDLRTVLSVGEVLTALVVSAGAEEDDFALTLSATAREPTLPAPPLLRGGPAWLVAPERGGFEDTDDDDTDGGIDDAPDSEPSAGQPAAVPDPALVALQQERDQLLAELQRAEARLGRANRQAATVKTELRLTRERAVLAERGRAEAESRLAGQTVVAPEPLFADRLQQLEFDVAVTWAYRTSPGEKADLPLARWTVGDRFFDSWDEVQGVEVAKVVEVVVDVLTGRAEQLPGRSLHQLRSGHGGGDSPVVRPDGATCWRVALQQRTAAARRLHFWRLNNGSVELSSIRLHDNMAP